MCFNYLSNCMPQQLQTKYGVARRNDQSYGHVLKKIENLSYVRIVASLDCRWTL